MEEEEEEDEEEEEEDEEEEDDEWWILTVVKVLRIVHLLFFFKLLWRVTLFVNKLQGDKVKTLLQLTNDIVLGRVHCDYDNNGTWCNPNYIHKLKLEINMYL